MHVMVKPLPALMVICKYLFTPPHQKQLPHNLRLDFSNGSSPSNGQATLLRLSSQWRCPAGCLHYRRDRAAAVMLEATPERTVGAGPFPLMQHKGFSLTGMKIFFHPEQLLLHPQTYLSRGQMRKPQEVPERAAAILRGVNEFGFDVQQPTDHGMAPLLAVVGC